MDLMLLIDYIKNKTKNLLEYRIRLCKCNCTCKGK